MRWNPFRRAEIATASDSSFESTVVDDAAVARLSQAGVDVGAMPPAPPLPRPSSAALAAGLIVESDSIGHVGRYALKTVLGKGGLGTVYAAWDPLLSRTVALKTLHIDADPAAREALDALFLNEARAAAGLSHPHIVTVFDAGPSETGVYIAMERLQGQDLRHLLQQGVRPGPVEAAQVMRRVADALAYAHRKGVVHCDMKPANIFMTGRMHPKVLDFGIARVAHRDVPALDGVVAGSPHYLAPEQLDGRSVDRRSDVYSLGVVLYELLVGKKPFEGQSLEEITQAVRTAEIVPAHRVSSKIPLGLSVIAGRAMARDPDQRYPSARHLSMELRHWVDSAEARALRNESRGAGSRRPLALRVARVAVPLGALGVLGGLWWTKAEHAPDAHAASAPLSTHAATADVPPTVAPAALPVALSAAPSASGLAMTTEPGTAVAPIPPVVVRSLASLPTALPTSLPPSSPVIAASDPDAAAPTAAATTPASPATHPLSAAATRAAERASAAQAKAEARKQRKALALADATTQAAAPSEGEVRFAVSPWGQVEVDGRIMGISPPLTHLTLSSGNHTITVRNADFPAYTTTLAVSGDNPATLHHRFGP